MRKRLSLVIAGAAGLLIALVVPVFAHHAFSAEYDSTKPVTLRGTVKKMEWINPHSWMTLEVKTDDGKVETWEVEAGAPILNLSGHSLLVGVRQVIDWGEPQAHGVVGGNVIRDVVDELPQRDPKRLDVAVGKGLVKQRCRDSVGKRP